MTTENTAINSNLRFDETGYVDFSTLAASGLNNCGRDGSPGDADEWLTSYLAGGLVTLIEARGERAVNVTPSEQEGVHTLWVHPAIAMAFSLQGNPAFVLQLSDQLTGITRG